MEKSVIYKQKMLVYKETSKYNSPILSEIVNKERKLLKYEGKSAKTRRAVTNSLKCL